MMTIPFSHSYAALPPLFHRPVLPTPVSAPSLIRFNHPLANHLGLDPEVWGTPDKAAIWAGNAIPDGARPIATAYAAHQFGQFVPLLGDGRAILLGEIIASDGKRHDIQLKGAGPTPFSRNGDGRAALGPVLREYIVSEAMAALGVPTTRSLAATATGDIVWRETKLPGAVLTRVAQSHIRIGTFQFFAARGEQDLLAALLDHAIERHDPDLTHADNKALAFLARIADRQADLVARWLALGFIHGVMNTDNMAISGETIDYGPCAFLDEYNPAKVFSSIDHGGRYAFRNQPAIAQWNLARLAETLLPLIDADENRAVEQASATLDGFAHRFNARWLHEQRQKFGLLTEREEDEALMRWFQSLMQDAGADHTRTFRALVNAIDGDHGPLMAALGATPALSDWLAAWRERRAIEAGDDDVRLGMMRRANPAVIPRNHRIEQAIASAVSGDFAPFHAMVERLADPVSDADRDDPFIRPPDSDERVLKTFCGT